MSRRILPVLIIAVGIGTFLMLKESRPVPVAVVPKERIWRVEVMTAPPSEHRPILSLFGRIEAPDRVRAAAPVAGRLIEINVRDGDLVSEGELLAKLDPRDLLPRLEKAKADLEKERLQLVHDREALEHERQILELGRLAVERANTVQTKKLGSVSSVDEAREQYARAQLAVTLREQSIAEHPARLATLEAALEEAERDVARGTITAPFDGRIGVVEAAAGDQLQPNETILTLYPLDGLYIRAKVPGAYSDELREALTKGARLEAEGLYSGQPISAVLERLSGEADARGVDALLRLAPGVNAPLGAFVSLQLERPGAPDTVALPFAALHGGDRIFVVEDGRLKGLRIQRVGELVTPDTGENRVLIRAPELKADARVLVTHLPHAVETLKVEPLQ
ncbi:efflux RND transporter periplasmic adaptor subunit [Thiorhodococcus minor]|uniref:Efflux RND transporter periplasmic adaptor subunit n=1 Tax=Thiorhodococcus minor TaxID=57489 RepID=A0A6M0K044_9GAMM|nr:efflux RND transporter periplasmic adaptor subunit [Thiorhodococcus minor]NEV62739.1 efflux RND transporter periplasmic adaptor subunit [Thiorhodococcus minor]